MRGSTAGWARAAVLVALAVGGRAGAQGKTAAVVNGEPIPMAEVDAVFAMRPPELFPVPQTQKRQLQQEVLDGLVSERLMRQYLAKHGPTIDTAEVDRQMSALAESQKAAGKTLADFCRESHQTEAQVRASVQNMLQFSAFAKSRATD